MKSKTKSGAKNLMPDGNGNRSKYYIDGVSLFRYCREHHLSHAEYSRCLWLIKNKCMSAQEALQYHRPPANKNKAWIRKVNQRRRYGIKKEYLELKDKYIIEMGYDKQSKYFYKGIRLRKYCDKHNINYSTVVKRICKFGLNVEEAVRFSKKQVIEWIKNNKKPDYSLGRSKRKIINLETLEVFNSLTDAAKALGVTVAGVYNGILLRKKCKGQHFEFLDEWFYYTSQEKEKWTGKNNIYFL